MKKNKKLLIVLICLFVILLGTTLFVSFSSNKEVQEIVIKSMTPVYDETSGVVVSDERVVFNDKNQVVKYNVVLENTQDYDVKISDIKLSTPTEEFLQYKVEGISTDDVVKANSTKELTISFETMGIEGWGRNFADELTANISFEKIAKQEVVPPVEEDKEEEKQPEAPATNIEEVINKAEKIEVNSITNNIIEFKEDIKVEEGKKIAVWIYSNPKFLGYFDVVVTNGIKQIAGLEDALKKAQVETGEHSIVLATEEKEVLGYVNIYINENKELLIEKPQDTTDKEDSTINKPSEDLEEEPKEDETGKVENPYTSDKKLVGILCIATCITGVSIIIVSKNKLTKYTVFVLMLSPAFTITNAEEVVEVTIKNNISFKSQNVMKPSYILADDGTKVKQDYWAYREQIKNFYIHNEVIEIKDYAHKFDVTESGNARVIAYLVANKDDASYYDAYLVADGIIYPNQDAYSYFHDMKNLDILENLAGLDTSEVTDMSGMFSNTGYNSKSFTLDLSGFNTNNVTNMRGMFQLTGYNSSVFTLDVSNFDTSNVTNMSYMFNNTGYNSKIIELDVSNFDTSNVTNMIAMFQKTGYSNPSFTLDVSNFDTSNVTDMSYMFNQTGFVSTMFELDVSNFDTSKVTSMKTMFQNTGITSPNFILDVSNFDTSNVTDMSYMFNQTGFVSTMFELDVSNFDTSNVTNMSYMFAYAGYSNPSFTLNVSNFDMNKVTNVEGMFSSTGYNSSKLKIDLTINNTCINSYKYMLSGIAVTSGSKVRINYTKAADNLVDNLISTKVETANVSKGYLIVDVDNLSVGDEIHIAGERFNVITQTDNTITMLAQYNLKPHFRQSTWANIVLFSDSNGWNYKPAPQEIDIQVWSTYVSELVNGYVDFLKTELEDNSITGDLITLKQLELLGCKVPPDYATGAGGWTCADSNYKSWLINDQSWWTRSAHSTNSEYLWAVKSTGELGAAHHSKLPRGVRPTLTISKEVLKNNIEKYKKKES